MGTLIAAKMFTSGQITFGIFFAIAFISFMVFSYIKDAKNHKKHYQNTAIYVAIALVATIGLLYLSKSLFSN